MNNIANKAIVLKLNRRWNPVGVALVSKTLADMMTGVVLGMDICYPLNEDGTPNFEDYGNPRPVTWDEWITLPVREWDLAIHSPRMTIRVPTVIITAKYDKIPEKTFKGKPTKEGVYIRDNGIDGYTGREIDFSEATLDHVIPKHRGGTDTYDNVVLTTKEINNRKGNKLNSEAGLKLVVQPHHPKPLKAYNTIRKIRHHDWKNFLTHTK